MTTLKKEDTDRLAETAWDLGAECIALRAELRATREFLILYRLARLWAWIKGKFA